MSSSELHKRIYNVLYEAAYPHIKHSCNTNRWVEAMVEDMTKAVVVCVEKPRRKRAPSAAEVMKFAKRVAKGGK